MSKVIKILGWAIQPSLLHNASIFNPLLLCLHVGEWNAEGEANISNHNKQHQKKEFLKRRY